jgi:dolichol kinase
MIASLLSGFLGATAELIPIKKLDDNLTLPIVSGLGLTAIFYIFDFL